MSELVGYGNAAGFLLTKGFSPTTPPARPNEANAPINPVTGLTSSSEPTHDQTMTDMEKEREAEKLFVLFDRLEKNPATSVGVPGRLVNPVKQAVESGRWDELDESVRVLFFLLGEDEVPLKRERGLMRFGLVLIR